MLEPQKWEVIAGRYRLERELARGGMGSVWTGQDKKLRRSVAVKLVTPTWAGAAEARAQFEREAMAVAQLQSPHVVQIYDFGVERECPYIVMELLEGEDLRTRLQRFKRVTLETAAQILVQTAKALSVAHAVGIVHRDLKPGNIFLVQANEEELVKVLDFGVAKQVQTEDLLKHGRGDEPVMGTPQFMSPEQARGLSNVDHRSDLWALGVIIYRALTGHLPFHAPTPTEVIVQVCTKDPRKVSDLAPDLPAELDAFFARALARDPNQRFESARQMTLAFSRISPVTFTTLSMPDPDPAIEEAIRMAKAAAGAAAADDDDDEDEATVAVDALSAEGLAAHGLFDDDLDDVKTGVNAGRGPPATKRGQGPPIPAPTPPPRRSHPGPLPPPPPRTRRFTGASAPSGRRVHTPPPVPRRKQAAATPVAKPAANPLSLATPEPPSVDAETPLVGAVLDPPVSVPIPLSPPLAPLLDDEDSEGHDEPPEPSPVSASLGHSYTTPEGEADEPSDGPYPVLAEPPKSNRSTMLLALGAIVVGVMLAVVGSSMVKGSDGEPDKAAPAIDEPPTDPVALSKTTTPETGPGQPPDEAPPEGTDPGEPEGSDPGEEAIAVPPPDKPDKQPTETKDVPETPPEPTSTMGSKPIAVSTGQAKPPPTAAPPPKPPPVPDPPPKETANPADPFADRL